MNIIKTSLAALLVTTPATTVLAQDGDAALINRNTTLKLIEALVRKGVLDRDSADTMIREAREQAVAEAKAGQQDHPPANAAASPATTPAATGQGQAPASGDSIHVGYVPQFMQRQIREQVRTELKDEPPFRIPHPELAYKAT